jgi:two-component system sensor histidine kinase KdpD
MEGRTVPAGTSGGTMERAAQRIRLVLALAVATAIPFTPGLTRAERFGLAGLVLVYAALAATFDELGARRSSFPARSFTALAGVATIFVATLVLPELQPVALGFYVLVITFSTGVAGLRLGLVLSAVAIGTAVTANVLGPRTEQVAHQTLVVFTVLLPAFALAADAVARGRRRTVERLARLHDALRDVSVTADLQATLDSIVQSSAEAVGAAAAGILLREGEQLVPAAATGEQDWMSKTGRDAAPFSRALTRRETVVVSDRAGDGLVALVAVPLRVGRDVIGVLAVGFSKPGGPPREDLTLLETYAEQISLVIVRAQAAERERQAAEQIAEADRLKGEFLGIVSHELRTPLTAVKGFVDTVLLHWERLPDERRRELLGRASGNADELNRLVGQLLDFARIDADRVRLDPQVLTVRLSVETVLEELAPALARHRIEIDVPEPLAVTADPDALAHVLTNLLVNASKFAPARTGVRVCARQADDEVVISVVDEGPGVAPADRERVFERFYQGLDTSSARKGTGIGLAIARTLVELHGGRIWVDGEPGHGATFSFTLPVAAAAGVASGEPRAAAAGG